MKQTQETLESKFAEVFKQLDEKARTPGSFVTAVFGDNWQGHTRDNLEGQGLTTDDIINMAWFQGRRAILMGEMLKVMIQQYDELEEQYEQLQRLVIKTTKLLTEQKEKVKTDIFKEAFGHYIQFGDWNEEKVAKQSLSAAETAIKILYPETDEKGN